MLILKNTENEIGTAKDNLKSPVHDWYRFTAGFSYRLVDEIIKAEKLTKDDVIFESFAGCGTTLVTSQKHEIKAIGNEGQELLLDVINAKLNWNIDKSEIESILLDIKAYLKKNNRRKKFDTHELLSSLYEPQDLKELNLIKEYLYSNKVSEENYLFLKLALSQTLHKVCVHPIAVPYISRNKTLVSAKSASEVFFQLVNKMLKDLTSFQKKPKTSEIYLHDSRTKNPNITDESCSVCITSPPYLNNLDYGEVSKVCSHFYGITTSWGDITEKVRKNLVTGATTHYKEIDFKINDWTNRPFYKENEKVGDLLINKAKEISSISKTRGGKKSFDILTLYYFEDMYKVLQEIFRVLKKGKRAYLVLGDSAPYGVHIDTTNILGLIGLNTGFKKYDIIKIRERGTKWKSLTHRHSLKLSESILILEK